MLLGILLALPVHAATPSIDDPPASGVRAPNDMAVVIANEQYTGFGPVSYATRDADAFAAWLTRTRGLPAVNVVRINGASRKGIEDAVARAAANAPAGGTLWVYYAGHGVGLRLDGGQAPERVLLGINAIAKAEELPDYAVPVAQLERLAAGSKAAQAVFVLDACFNNAGRDGVTLVSGRFAVPVPKLTASAKVTIWSATDAEETAVPYEPARHGAFTYFAVGALSGWADGVSGTPDGRVSLDEAQTYVARAMSSVGILGQSPQLVGERGISASSGKLVTAPERLEQSGTIATPVPTGDDYISRFAALQAEQKRLADEHARHVTERRRVLEAQAASEWIRAKPVVDGGGDAAMSLIDAFLARWKDRVELVDSESITVAIPVVAEAETMKARLGRFTSKTTAYAMVKINAGKFTMGSPDTELDRVAANEAAHLVTLTRPFLLGTTELTQAQWRAVAGENPSETDFLGVSLVGDRYPVQNVDWCDAVWFANALSKADGLRPAYAGIDTCAATGGDSVTWDQASDGYRLPTEAEWEYAARAGSTQPWVSGSTANTVCGDGNIADAAARQEWGDWDKAATCDDGIVGLAAVGRYRPNAWGIYDVAGNVLEWVWDRPTLSAGGAETDPVGLPSGTSRAFRGGAWHAPASDARLAQRSWNLAETRGNGLGIRLARTLR